MVHKTKKYEIKLNFTAKGTEKDFRAIEKDIKTLIETDKESIEMLTESVSPRSVDEFEIMNVKGTFKKR
jgi:hypothetical protein